MATQAAVPEFDLLSQTLHAGQAILASVFAVAAWTKLRRADDFVSAVRGYAIVPARLASAVAWMLVMAETAVALSLFTGLAADEAAVGSATLLAVFLAGVLITLRRGSDVSCGCFGAREERVSRATAARLIALLTLATGVAIAWSASHHAPLTLGWIGSHGTAGVEEAFVAATIAAAALIVASYASSGTALRMLARSQRSAWSRARNEIQGHMS